MHKHFYVYRLGTRDMTYRGRQKEILDYLAQGYTDVDIAEKLHLSLKGLRRNTLRSIRNKTNIRELDRLMQYARDNGFGKTEGENKLA